MSNIHSDKAALRGEPSYVWRAGQDRRMQMILAGAEERIKGKIIEIGVGLGAYLSRLEPDALQAIGLDVEHERAKEAHHRINQILCGVGEHLPFPSNSFDVILSHEVIEHVTDDRQSVMEMVRALKPGGRIILFCPNRGYPYETHGIYWRGKYKFGNIPLINYLPDFMRNKLAPHVRVYTRRQLAQLFKGLPVVFIQRSIIFGAYDNIIARKPALGSILRKFLHFIEKTPLKVFGLSHLWVIEKQR